MPPCNRFRKLPEGNPRFPAQTLVAAVVVILLAPWVSPSPAVGQLQETSQELRQEPQREFRQELRGLVSEARDRVFPALVNIEVKLVAFYGGKEVKGRSIGSGTIISAEGHVLTNYHVTAGGHQFLCTLSDKREVAATLVGEDPLTDLAVLQLDLDSIEGSLAVAELGDSDKLEVGDHVLAMGSPFALSRSVTLGIVSNVERVFAGGLGGSANGDDFELSRGVRTGLFTRWIQHDALINPGNSGGPLVDLEGRIVGINELGGNSIGFAIPANLAREVADSLMTHGEVPRSWIGATFKTVGARDRDDGEVSPQESAGALIGSLVEEGPAAQGGLIAGDLLLAIDGEAVAARFPEEIPLLMKEIADRPVGSSLELRYRRDEKEATATVTTERLDRDRGKEVAFRAWGMTGQAITPKLQRDRGLADTAGVFISGVRPGGPAQLAEPPLLPGDVVRAVDEESVTNLDTLLDRYNALTAPDAPLRELLVEVDRGGQNTLTLLKSRLEDDEDQPRELPKAWLGVATQPLLRPLAEKLSLGSVRGFRVTRIYPGSEAEKAGLEVGDVITAVEGEPMTPRGMQDVGLLSRRIQQLEIESQAKLTLMRDGEEQQIPVTLERSRRTPQEARRDRDRDFELVVREVTFFDRDERRWEAEVRGVLVDSVEPAGWAGSAGLRAGDLIQRIGDQPVRGLKSYRKALEVVSREREERIVVVVRRGLRALFFALEPDWSPVAAGDLEPAR